jgi:hypothetical protein
MRMLIAAALVMMTSAAFAEDYDVGGAHKLAIQGRDDYWHCLAREYSRDSNQASRNRTFPVPSPAPVHQSARTTG